MTQTSSPFDLQALRKQLKAQRNAIPIASKKSADDKINTLLDTWLQRYIETLNQGVKTLAAFWPLGSEPDLRPLLQDWDAHPLIQLALPVVTAQHTPLIFKRWQLNRPMQQAAYGIWEPTGALCQPDILLIPLLGFTQQGDRLGYGGGYYDRTLAQFKQQNHPTIKIGVAYECASLDKFNYIAQVHDQPLDALVTEKQFSCFDPRLNK